MPEEGTSIAPAAVARRRRLSIPTRLFMGFVLVLLAFGIVAITSLVQHARTARTLNLLQQGYLPLALSIGEAKATQAVFGTLLDRVLDEKDTNATRSWLAAARRVRPVAVNRALERVARAERLEPSPEDRDTLRALRRELESVREAYRDGEGQYAALQEALLTDDEILAAATLQNLRSKENENQQSVRRAWSTLQQRLATVSAIAAEREQQAVVFLALLAALALLVGVGVAVWSQRVLAPLPRLEERVAAVARGDLARRLEPARDDELGHLTSEFERMVETLAARDARLRVAAEAYRRLQRMQEQIVAGLRAAVLVVDADGVLRTTNPAAASVLAVSPDEEGETLEVTGLPVRLPELEAAIAAVAAGEERAFLNNATLMRDGDERKVDVLVTPFELDTNAQAQRAVLVVAEDVTDELRTKARLIHTERLAAIGRMASHVTHEVRNPLSSIGLNVEMLADEVEGAEAIALLRAIQLEIDRLTSITEEYLRLARLPAPHREAEDLGGLIDSVVAFLRREMDAAQVTLDVKIDADLPYVAVDEAQIRQALLNLLKNAREAMPDGGVIRVRVELDGDEVRVIVADQGNGIDSKEREHIFDLFYTTKVGGTGLGLPLTQQIVAAHGGRITCVPAAGGGTAFEIHFPALVDGALASAAGS